MQRVELVNGKRKVVNVGKIEFDLQFDVVVAGIGSGGCYASISASKNGCSVLAFDKDYTFGGMTSTGIVGSYYYGYDGGTYKLTDEECRKNADFCIYKWEQPILRQSVLAKRLKEENIQVMVATVLTALYMDGDTVIGAELLNDGKLVNVKSKQFIDSTSEGYIVRYTGVKYKFGRDTDGTTAQFSAQTHFVKEDGKYGQRFGDSGTVNQFSAKDYSEKVLLSRKQHISTKRAIDLGVAELPGLREGIHFKGEETLLYKNASKLIEPKKTLFYAYSDSDKHSDDSAIDDEVFQNIWVISNMSTLNFRIAVPYGAVVPKGIKGFVTACRCLSADSYILGAVRMNRDIHRLGECVGLGVALAVKHNCSFMQVDYAEYKEKALKSGAFLGDENKIAGFDRNGVAGFFKNANLNCKEKELRAELDSLKPAVAIYNGYFNKRRCLPIYKRIYNAPDSRLQKENTAIALGLSGDKSCLETLREMVINRSERYFLDCRRSNQFPSVIAICLLGRLGEEKDLELLEKIVFDRKEYSKELYHTPIDMKMVTKVKCNYVFYSHFSHALISLIKLVNKFGKQKEYKEKIEKLLTGESKKDLLKKILVCSFSGEIKEGNISCENTEFESCLENLFNYAIKLIK